MRPKPRRRRPSPHRAQAQGIVFFDRGHKKNKNSSVSGSKKDNGRGVVQTQGGRLTSAKKVKTAEKTVVSGKTTRAKVVTKKLPRALAGLTFNLNW